MSTEDRVTTIFAHALGIVRERDERYKGGWKTRGWKGNVCDVLRKSARIRSYLWEENGLDEPYVDVDDLYDQMVYCAFTIANIEDGNKWGDHRG